MRQVFCLLALMGLSGGNVLRGDETLPLATLTALKKSTVYIKVRSGSDSASGSGFAIYQANDIVYLVTNDHVIEGPRRSERVILGPPTGPMFGPRFGVGPRGLFLDTTPTIPQSATITVVFHGGTPNEKVYTAQVRARDANADLAILTVSGVTEEIPVINVKRPATPIETMPVYVLGFPFGEALASGSGNPAITVGKGNVSSIRLDAAGVTDVIQLDGSLNPGNSGGPIVDANGKLVGVAVKTVVGAGIGMAIPPAKVLELLRGRVELSAATSIPQGEQVQVTVSARLADPMQNLTNLTAFYLENRQETKFSTQEALSVVPGVKKLVMARSGDLATAKFSLPKPKTTTNIIAQVEYSRADGKRFFDRPMVLVIGAPVDEMVNRSRIPTRAAPSTSRPNSSRTEKPRFPTSRRRERPLGSLDNQDTDDNQGKAVAPQFILPNDGWGYRALAFSPERKFLAAGKMDGAIVLFDLSKTPPRKLGTFMTETSSVTCLAFSSDGKFLLAGTQLGKVLVHDVASNGLLQHQGSYLGHQRDVTSMIVTTDGKHVLSGAADKRLHYWTLENQQPVRFFEGFTTGVKGCYLAPTGKFATAWDGSVLMEVDIETGKRVRQNQLARSSGMGASLSVDGKLAASHGAGALVIWDTRNGSRLHQLEPRGLPWVTAFSRDNRFLFVGENGKVQQWDIDKCEMVQTYALGALAAVQNLALSDDGQFLAAASNNASGEIAVFDLNNSNSGKK